MSPNIFFVELLTDVNEMFGSIKLYVTVFIDKIKINLFTPTCVYIQGYKCMQDIYIKK